MLISAVSASPASWLLRMILEDGHFSRDSLTPNLTSIKARVEFDQVSLSVRTSPRADTPLPETDVHIQATCPALVYQMLVAVQSRLKV